jgi:hypothetical protein
VSEIGFARDMKGRDTGVEAIVFPLLFISDDREESLQIMELLQPLEQLKKKEADGVISMASHGGVS